VGGELDSIHAGAQAPEGASVVLLYGVSLNALYMLILTWREQRSELAIDGLDHLARGVIDLLPITRDLALLVAVRPGAQDYVIDGPQLCQDRNKRIAVFWRPISPVQTTARTASG